ncbi:hypothetical protein [Bradyrhizobium sp. LMG 9283]|uniref:hypothetical protein n=1 Tax=Bradyrhizobium sp. LMG 9283 TaxID=592064 RepID=UPI00388EA108
MTNLISLFCILSWRVFWMTMLNRSAPDAPPTLALTATEIGVSRFTHRGQLFGEANWRKRLQNDMLAGRKRVSTGALSVRVLLD